MPEHITTFKRGHDCLNFECICGSPDCRKGSGGFHGSSGMIIHFAAMGEHGAVSFAVNTGWLPQQTLPNSIRYRSIREWCAPGSAAHYPMPLDLGYHSKTPRYEGQTICQDKCEYCDGKPCYYDGSGLNANDAMYALVNGGDKALWEFLDAYYECVFNAAKYPTPAEYFKPRKAP